MMADRMAAAKLCEGRKAAPAEKAEKTHATMLAVFREVLRSSPQPPQHWRRSGPGDGVCERRHTVAGGGLGHEPPGASVCLSLIQLPAAVNPAAVPEVNSVCARTPSDIAFLPLPPAPLPPSLHHDPSDPHSALVPVSHLTPLHPGVRLDVDLTAQEVTLLPVTRGKGAYGKVVEGLYGGQRVAVKLLDWGLGGPPLPAGQAGGAEGGGGAGAQAAERDGYFAVQDLCEREAALAREVEVLGRCRHPNIVRLLAANLRPPRVCLVMELLDTSLDSLIHGTGRRVPLLPLPKVLHIAIQVAQGLEYLHPTILHRDLKPANVLVSNPGSPQPIIKLADFGLSRLLDTVLITQHPEAGTDMYAYGCLLYEMLSGRRPWSAERGTAVQIACAVAIRGERPPLHKLSQQRCPPKLHALIRACWDGEPTRRPAAAEAVKVLILVQQHVAAAPAAAATSAASGPTAAAASALEARPLTLLPHPLVRLDMDLAAQEVTLLPVTRGKGSYGRVVEGLYGGQRVAVKLLDWGLAGTPLPAGQAAGAEGGGGAGTQAAARDGYFEVDVCEREAALAREVEVLGRCRHPNIVRLLAANLQPPRVCLVMELLDTSLDSLIHGADRRAPLLPLPKVLHIAIQVAQGLEYLHPTILHRDLKSANVLVSNPGSPQPIIKLADFGLSRLLDTVLITQHPEEGTASHMAPETFDLKNFTITDKVDMYAYGCLLYEMLSGKRPWSAEGGTALQIACAVAIRGERPPLHKLSQQRCPPKLHALIRACWDGDPARRPAAAEAVKVLTLVQQ
ncbi:Serine/threonine-protein kinase HT1, partial [Tetrabaena socialis]